MWRGLQWPLTVLLVEVRGGEGGGEAENDQGEAVAQQPYQHAAQRPDPLAAVVREPQDATPTVRRLLLDLHQLPASKTSTRLEL